MLNNNLNSVRSNQYAHTSKNSAKSMPSKAQSNPRFGNVNFLQAVETGAGLGAGLVLGNGLILLGLGGIAVVVTLGAAALSFVGQAVPKAFFGKNDVVNNVAVTDLSKVLDDISSRYHHTISSASK